MEMGVSLFIFEGGRAGMLLGTPPERKPLLKYLTGREKRERKQCKGGWGEGTLVSGGGKRLHGLWSCAHLCTGQRHASPSQSKCLILSRLSKDWRTCLSWGKLNKEPPSTTSLRRGMCVYLNHTDLFSCSRLKLSSACTHLRTSRLHQAALWKKVSKKVLEKNWGFF